MYIYAAPADSTAKKAMEPAAANRAMAPAERIGGEMRPFSPHRRL